MNYYEKPFTRETLRQLLKKLKIPAASLLREGEAKYRELKLAQRKDAMTEDELIDLMLQHPDLIQRPIIERGNRAVIGRPTENIRDLL